MKVFNTESRNQGLAQTTTLFSDALRGDKASIKAISRQFAGGYAPFVTHFVAFFSKSKNRSLFKTVTKRQAQRAGKEPVTSVQRKEVIDILIAIYFENFTKLFSRDNALDINRVKVIKLCDSLRNFVQTGYSLGLFSKTIHINYIYDKQQQVNGYRLCGKRNRETDVSFNFGDICFSFPAASRIYISRFDIFFNLCNKYAAVPNELEPHVFESLWNPISKVSGALDGVARIGGDISRATDVVDSSVKNAINTVTTITQLILSKGEEFTTSFEQLKQTLVNVCSFVVGPCKDILTALVFSMLRCFTSPSEWKQHLMLSVAELCTRYCADAAIEYAMKKFMSKITDAPTAHTVDVIDQVWSAVRSVIAISSCGMIFASGDSNKSIMGHLSKLDSFTDSVCKKYQKFTQMERIFQSLHTYSDMIFKFVYRLLSGEEYKREMDDTFGRVYEWVQTCELVLKRDVRSFLGLPDDSPVSVTDLTASQTDLYNDKIEALYCAGQRYLIEMQRTKDGSLDHVIFVIKTQLNMLQHKCKGIHEKYVNRTKGNRKEPSHLVLCGPPGHGKSTLLEIVYNTFFMSRGFSTDTELEYLKKNEVYVSGGLKHENGYKNQMIFVFDDAGQKQTSAGDPDEYYEKIVHYKNSAPCNMSMAALEDKNLMMTSDLIVTTTNSTLKDRFSLVDFTAFERRVDMKLLVLLDPDVLKYPSSKKKFDYSQGLDAISKAYVEQQKSGCSFSMGVCDKHKISAKYGENTFEAYRFVLLDQTSPTGIKPLLRYEANGKTFDTSKMFGIDQFEEMFCTKQKELTQQKDVTTKVVKNYNSQARERIAKLMAHSVQTNEYCWKGSWCANSQCGKMHPLGITTLAEALSLKFQSGAFVDPVSLQLKTCVSGTCDQSTPHSCVALTDLQLLAYTELNLSSNISIAELNMPVSKYVEIVQEHTSDDMSVHTKLATERNPLTSNYFEEVGGLSGMVEYLKNGTGTLIAPIFERARASFHEKFLTLKQKFEESIFGQNLALLGALFAGVGIVFAGGYYYFFSQKLKADGHVVTATQKARKRAAKQEIAKQKQDGVFFEIGNECSPKWSITNAETNFVSELNKASYALFKTKKADTFDGTNGDHQAFANVTCIKGCIYVTAGHVIKCMQDWFDKDPNNCIIMKNQIRHVGVAIMKEDLSYFMSSCSHYHITDTRTDMGFFSIDQEVIPPGRDLTKYLISDKTKIPDLSLCISVSYERQDDGSVSKYNLSSMINSGIPRRDIALNFKDGRANLCEAYTMVHSMKAGQSGANVALVSGSNTKNPTIFGVYNGGNSEVGIVTRLNLHQFTEAEFALGQQISFQCLDVKPGLVSEFYTGNKGEVTFEGKIEKSVIGAKNTAIVPSGLHGKLHEVQKKPAHLTTFKDADGNKINPRRNAERKYFTPNANIDRFEAEQAVEGAVRFSARNYRKTLDRVLTTQEAVLGIVGEQYIDAIKSSSSSGHIGRDLILSLPEEQLYEIKKRIAAKDEVSIEAVKINNRCFKEIQLMFTESENDAFNKDVSKFVNLYEEYEKDALEKFSRKERINQLWEDQLKDETRPFAKVEIGKTRMFNCSANVCYLIMVRKWCMGFAATTMEGRVYNGMAVGVNCYGEDWDNLYHEITKFGEKQIFAGDFGAFDSSHNFILNSRMMRLINKYFYPSATKEDNNIREMLWLEIVNSVHVNENDILTWTKGMPSGNPLTTLINCLVNNTAMRLCWNRAMKQAGLPQYANSESFEEFCGHISYGDDSITYVHEDFSEVFNQEVVAALMPKFGFEYTDEQKQDASLMVPFRHIDEIGFLKRKFRKCPRTGFVCAPIDPETIFGMTDYVRDKNNVPQQTIENAKNALREASLHDQDFFEDFYLKIRQSIEEIYPGVGKTFNGNYWDQREIIRESDFIHY